MAKNHTFLFSSMVIVMALLLQSQSSSCCSTPNPPEQTPTAIGTLYLPLLAPAVPPYQNTLCNGSTNSIHVFLIRNPPQPDYYPILVDEATQYTFFFKVRVRSTDGCYQKDTYINPTSRAAVDAVKHAFKIPYPTGKPYIIDVWAQICPECLQCWYVPGENGTPEWHCTFANAANQQQVFGAGNPYDLTMHQIVKDVLKFGIDYVGSGSGSVEAKFKYSGNIPFGTNVLP